MQTLVEGGFHHACIAGHDGAVWAATPTFKVLPKEIGLLSSVLGGGGGGGGGSDADGEEVGEAMLHVRQKGFTVQGRQYAVSRVDEGDDLEVAILIGRCKQYGSASRGVVVAKTAQTIIIGVHDPIFAEGISFGKSNVAMFQLAETLISMNF